MSIVFEVIMIDGHCPNETCSMGIFKTRDSAEQCIEKESVQYSDHMMFEIEEKYFGVEA